MKRIVCFIESLSGGGAEHQMQILCECLCNKGYDLTLVTYADLPDHYTCSPRVRRIVLGKGKGIFGKFFSICHFFLTVKTDCVISYRVACNARVLFPLLLRPKVNVIVGERNFTINKRSFLGKLCSNILYYRADHIVPNSFSQEKYLRSLGRRWADRVCTIINYTDINQFHKSDIPVSGDIVKIAIFARFSVQKNAPRFIKMLFELKTVSKVPFHVDWYGNRGVGDCSPEYVRSCRLIDELSLSDVITLKEPVRNPASLMSNYHAVCLPSLYEGFSNSIAEGICSGKPMLVSDVSDNSVMVKENVNGYLFDPTSINSMKEAFVKFFKTSPEQKVLMGENSRKIAETLFDADLFFKKHKQLIES